MAEKLAQNIEYAPLVACTVSRNVEDFDLLIEDMEAALGDGWGDLNFDEVIPFLAQSDADDLCFVTLAVDKKDEPRLSEIAALIKSIKNKNIDQP